MFDHAAASAQVAGCIAYAGPVQVMYTPPGGAPLGPFAAMVADEPVEAAGFDRNRGDRQAVILTIARSLLGSARPRQGETFTATDGRTFRILAEPANPTGPAAAFACAAS